MPQKYLAWKRELEYLQSIFRYKRLTNINKSDRKDFSSVIVYRFDPIVERHRHIIPPDGMTLLALAQQLAKKYKLI